MSSFLSATIDSIFCKYDDNYISPSVKRFLSECIIQLIDVSLLSINSRHHDTTNHTKLTLFHSHSTHNKQNDYSKQLSLLTEWLENFIEPSHISMFTLTIIEIIQQLQNTVTHSHKHRYGNHTHSVSSRTPRQSMSNTQNSFDFAVTPDTEKKHQRMSLFNKTSSNNNVAIPDDDEKYPQLNEKKAMVQRSSFTGNSQASEITLNLAKLQPQQSTGTNSEDNTNNHTMDLNWDKYEQMSFILIRSLTSILNQSLKRYNYQITVIFDDQFDKIVDDVIQFLFSRLTLSYSDKFRGIIGDCLGVISRKYLQIICQRIHLRWGQFNSESKKRRANDIKKFAILHRAVKYLEFDIYGRNRDAAIDYLTHLCIRMQRTENKILRQQICHSLLFIFDSISPQKENEDNKEEQETANKPFIRLCPKETDSEFWTLYYTIFNIVEQWSHKKGCTIFCYELIVKMMCCGNLPFYLHVLKYEPKSKSGYILPSLHRNRPIPKMIANHHTNSSQNMDVSSPHNPDISISALPDNPSKSPIIKFLISNLSNDNTKRDTLCIILQFIQELPEEFVTADNEWYAKLLHYLEDKIIYNSNPEQTQELKIIAAIFTAFAERDGKSYFVPAIQRLLCDKNPWWNRIGLETLHHAVMAFDHSLSRYNFTLGACLSPFVRGTKGKDFQQLALQCWPIIRSTRERVEDIHNEVMQMVQLIKNKQFARLAADNLINYVEIDFENHLVPVVSSLLSPMRDFDRFKEEHLKITIEVLSQIVKRLIKHLEYLEEYEGYYYLSQKHQYLNISRNANLSDSDYDELLPEEEKSHEFGSINNIIDAVANHNDNDDVNINTKQLHLPMAHHLNSIAPDQSVEYDDANQEFYRVKNALSLIEMWPHIRLLIEGYVLLWYLHPDEYIRDQLYELLSVIRHPIIINNVDPRYGPPSIYEQIQRYNSRHHKNDGYSNSGNVNMGTNTSSAASQSGLSNYSNERNDQSVHYDIKRSLYLNQALPQRHNFDADEYQIAHQFPPELERLIFKKRKFFEGLLNWVFLRTTTQLDTFFNEINQNLGGGEDVSMELYENDEFVLMKHRWELMCLSVRIDESYYQQTNDDKYIASFHRARSGSFDNKYYNKYNGYVSPGFVGSPHKRYTTQSSTNSSHHKQSVIMHQHHVIKGREVSQSNTIVINTASKLQHRVFNDIHHNKQDTNNTTIHHNQNTTTMTIDVDDTKLNKKKTTDSKNTSETLKLSVTGTDLAVQDLISSIKFSRSKQLTPTTNDLESAKNRLRLIGRPSTRRKDPTLQQDLESKDKQRKISIKTKQQSLKANALVNTPSTKTRHRLPSTSKESMNPPELEIDVKGNTVLGGPSPNGSPLPAPIMQGDSEESDDVDEDNDNYDVIAAKLEEDEDSKWNESEHEVEEKGDVVGPLLKDKDREKEKSKDRTKEKQHTYHKKKHPQVHYSEDVQFVKEKTERGHEHDYSESDNENIYNYHREQISMFLVPMTDIRIPKRMLNAFLDKIISFTLNIRNKDDDEILDSIFEPIQRMDVVVSELLIERLFRTAFSSEQLPHSENDSNYNKWRLDRLENFYFHGPTLHLLSVIYTNRGIMNYDYFTTTFHHPSNEFAIGLDKIIIATIYLVEVEELNTMREYEVILYLLILMKQFFFFYRNEEAKFRYHPFLDIPGLKNHDTGHGTGRVLLMKKPRPLSNMKMRRNLLDFIQTHMSPIPERLRKEIRKLEEKSMQFHHRREKKQNKERRKSDPDDITKRQEYKKLIYVHNWIEIALAECILGLIELGPIGEKTLEMELLKELEKYICHQNDENDNKLKKIAQRGMNAVFKHNSHLLEHFIQQSCKLHLYYNEFVVGSQNTIQTSNTSSNQHHRHNRNDKNITLISLAYLASLVNNFQHKAVPGVSPISALVLCMLHQCSPHQQARNLALKLAKCMANLKNENKYKFNYNPGAGFLFETTTSSPDKYLKFAFDYSHKISSLRPEIVPQIMYEVVRFYDRVESEYDREILLRLLPPWITQFSTVTNKIALNEITSCREMMYAFIVKLYELTKKASKSPNQSSKQLTLSYRLWHCLALSKPDKSHFDEEQFDSDKCSKYNEMLISEIVSYIISRYTLYFATESEICEKILQKICDECYRRDSSTNLLLLAKCLGESLHRYPDKFPLEPELFNKYKLTKYKKDIIKSTEQSAFKLIHRLLDFAIIDPFKKYIPLLLMNAAVINKTTFDDIVLRLAKYFEIDKRKKGKKKEKKKKKKKRKKQVIEEDENERSQFEGISFWKKYNPEMCKLWSDLAISWALQANKPHITMYSVEVFDALNSYSLNYDLLVQLSLITYHCVKQGNYPTALFTIILKILQKSLVYEKWQNDQYKIALSLAYILLSLQHESIHKSALTFWNKFLNLKQNKMKINIIGSMHNVLSFNNHKAIDQIIAVQLVHSLAREELFEVSVTMLEKLCCLLCHEIPAKSNKLLHLTVLSHMLRIQIVFRGDGKIQNANCDRLIHVLSHYKRETEEMIEQCRNIQMYSDFTEFLTETCRTYFRLFPSIAVFRGGLSALCKFIEYGSKLWYVSVLNIIDIILNVTETNENLLIDSAQFKQISSILVLASYLSPIKIQKKPPSDLSITKMQSIRKSSTKMKLSVKITENKENNKEINKEINDKENNDEEEDEYEYINLTPFISRIALKLTKRKQLRLPQDKKFLFQFIDPLPDSLNRIWKEMKSKRKRTSAALQKAKGPPVNLNKRLVLTIDEEKKCEEDTINRLKQYLLPLLTKAVRSSQASRHMRSGSILNFGVGGTAGIGALSISKNNKEKHTELQLTESIQERNENENENENEKGRRAPIIKIEKPTIIQENVACDEEEEEPFSHAPFNSSASNVSVVMKATPTGADANAEGAEMAIVNALTALTDDVSNISNTPQPHNHGFMDDDDDDDEEEEESKQIEYHGDLDVDDDVNDLDQSPDIQLIMSDHSDFEMNMLAKSDTVHIHKQHSTRDYGQHGCGDLAKEQKEVHQQQRTDTFHIKVDQLPASLAEQKETVSATKVTKPTKHVKDKSNSNNSVVENQDWQ